MSNDSLRTPLGRVSGLGSAKDGTHHWWMQRLTAIALIPLVVWFVASLLSLIGAERAMLVEWLSNPLAAILMVLFLATGFYHMKLGMQVVIEDYIHTEWRKVAMLVFNAFACIFLGVASILAVLKLSFGG